MLNRLQEDRQDLPIDMTGSEDQEEKEQRIAPVFRRDYFSGRVVCRCFGTELGLSIHRYPLCHAYQEAKAESS